MTVWPPQLMVSVSPATAPVPVRPTTTGVPSEASLALMPPPPFSGIEVIDGAAGATVSTVSAWRRRRGVAGRVGGHRRHRQRAVARRRHRGGPGAAGVDRHRRAVHRQRRADLRRPGHRDPARRLGGVDQVVAALDRGDRHRRRPVCVTCRRQPPPRSPVSAHHHRRAVRGLAGVDAACRHSSADRR